MHTLKYPNQLSVFKAQFKVNYTCVSSYFNVSKFDKIELCCCLKILSNGVIY